MKSSLISIFMGIVVGIIVIKAVEIGCFGDMPTNVDFENPAVLAEISKNITSGQFLLVLLGYALGSFAGGLVATRMDTPNGKRNAIIVASILMLANIANMLMMPHPVWFWLVSCCIYIPFALFGNTIYNKIKNI